VVFFVKYVRDKYINDFDPLIYISEGYTFVDFIVLKDKSDIGGKINMKMSAMAEANDLGGVINVADFSNEQKLGKGRCVNILYYFAEIQLFMRK
jgi:type I restriction enzyme M protein